jgi:hypothetical protein
MQHAQVEVFLCGEMGHTGHERVPQRPIIGPFGKDFVHGRIVEFIPIYGTQCLRGKETHAVAGGQCPSLESRPPAFLDIPRVTVDEVQRLMPSFEAALQAHMEFCSPSIVSGCTSHFGP